MALDTEMMHNSSPESLAAKYLQSYYGNSPIEYPINPFKMLVDEGILFSLMDFNKLEGVYIPASSDEDVPVVGINVNRPITRQRYTAAHELCHHLRDADKPFSCITNSRSNVERYAEDFAAALLMPFDELNKQVNKRRDQDGFITLDDVLMIAAYFGVSFQACLFRIAFNTTAMPGDNDIKSLKRIANKYKPENKRKQYHISNAKLYAGLIDCCSEQFSFTPTEKAKLLFQNEYIYNDSRMEGLDVTQEQASEIVTDIRLNQRNSIYCTEDNEGFLSIAGHYYMYQEVFSPKTDLPLNIYQLFYFNKLLFSQYPHPEAGGTTRQTDTIVLGAGFKSIDYCDIYPELNKLNNEFNKYFNKKEEMKLSEYLEHVVKTHHRITVIHPFSDGNGRTSRVFMNAELIKAGITPFYISVGDKDEYLSALARADECGDYNDLCELIYRLILKYYVKLNKE